MTTENVSVSLRMNKQLKNNMDKLCNELGLSMSAAFTIFAKAMVRKGGIPFEVKINIPNKETIEAIEEIEEIKKNPQNYKKYSNVKTMMEELLK